MRGDRRVEGVVHLSAISHSLGARPWLVGRFVPVPNVGPWYTNHGTRLNRCHWYYRFLGPLDACPRNTI